MSIKDEAKLIQEEIVNWRRELHRIPELGLNLPKTVAYVEEELKNLSIPYEKYVKGSAIVATVGKGDSKVIALRADMDGLPMKEEADVDFKSTNGNMHSCGHDAHTAMLLGAAKILKEHEGELKSPVKLFFQPGEEESGGAKIMVDEGVLEKHKVEAMVALHVFPLKGLKTGQIITKIGPLSASTDKIYIKIIGKSAHGSMPERGVDPVTISAQVINSIQTMVCREFSALDSVVVSLCNINSKMSEEDLNIAYNVIPNYVEIVGTIRTLDNSVRKNLFGRLDEIVKGIAASFNAKGEVIITEMYPVLVTSEDFTKEVVESAKEVVGSDNVILLPKPLMGSEDAAFFFEKVKGSYLGVISNNYSENNELYPNHNSNFILDEAMLHIGSALYAKTAIDFVNS